MGHWGRKVPPKEHQIRDVQGIMMLETPLRGKQLWNNQPLWARLASGCSQQQETYIPHQTLPFP